MPLFAQVFFPSSSCTFLSSKLIKWRLFPYTHKTCVFYVCFRIYLNYLSISHYSLAFSVPLSLSFPCSCSSIQNEMKCEKWVTSVRKETSFWSTLRVSLTTEPIRKKYCVVSYTQTKLDVTMASKHLLIVFQESYINFCLFGRKKNLLDIFVRRWHHISPTKLILMKLCRSVVTVSRLGGNLTAGRNCVDGTHTEQKIEKETKKKERKKRKNEREREMSRQTYRVFSIIKYHGLLWHSCL